MKLFHFWGRMTQLRFKSSRLHWQRALAGEAFTVCRRVSSTFFNVMDVMKPRYAPRVCFTVFLCAGNARLCLGVECDSWAHCTRLCASQVSLDSSPPYVNNLHPRRTSKDRPRYFWADQRGETGFFMTLSRSNDHNIFMDNACFNRSHRLGGFLFICSEFCFSNSISNSALKAKNARSHDRNVNSDSARGDALEQPTQL